jgi:hypothetical protein
VVGRAADRSHRRSEHERKGREIAAVDRSRREEEKRSRHVRKSGFGVHDHVREPQRRRVETFVPATVFM